MINDIEQDVRISYTVVDVLALVTAKNSKVTRENRRFLVFVL